MTHLAANGADRGAAGFGVFVGFLNKDFQPPVAAAPPSVSFVQLPELSSQVPNPSRFLPFVFEIRDPNFPPVTTTARVVSVEYSLDGGATFPFTAAVVPGDLEPFNAPPGGNRRPCPSCGFLKTHQRSHR